MIPFVPFQNTVKVTAVFTYDGQRVCNVMHYITDEDLSVADQEQIGDAWIDTWSAGLRSLVSNALGLLQVEVASLEAQEAPNVIRTTGLPLFGLESSQGLPANVTAAVKWTTNLKGRSYRGRTYHLGLTEARVTFNTIETAHLAALTTAYGEFLTLPYSGGPAVLGVASRFHNNVQRTTGVITPVTNVFIDGIVDSQRRRLPGRGR